MRFGPKGLCLIPLFLAQAALAQPGYSPGSVIPPPLAQAIIHGDTRIVVVGDSINVNTQGEPYNASHMPMVVGFARQWRPDHWHALYCPTAQGAPGGFANLRGVGGSTLDFPDTVESIIPVNTAALWPGNLTGFATEAPFALYFPDPRAAQWYYPRYVMRLSADETVYGSPVSRALLSSPNLLARNIVYTNPAMIPAASIGATLYNDRPSGPVYIANTISAPINNSTAGWTAIDLPIGSLPPSFNHAADTLRMDIAVTCLPDEKSNFITMGTLWEDAGVPGLQVHSIAQGGWTAADHLTTTGDARGYSDMGLRENLRVFGLADPSVTPIVMLCVGSNIGPNEAAPDGATHVFTDRINAIINRYDAALQQAGSNPPWFLLVGMYSGNFETDLWVQTRNDLIYEVARAGPRRGFINLRALLGGRGEEFQSAWYRNQPETTTTQPYTGGNTLSVETTGYFISTADSFYATDGVHHFMGTFDGITGTQLLNVSLPGALAQGARIVPSTFDSHLSLPGSDRIATAIWTEFTSALSHCQADFNQDGDSGTDADIEAFFACLAGNCCPTCGTADFNNDGDTGTDADIEAFFRVLAGGPC